MRPAYRAGRACLSGCVGLALLLSSHVTIAAETADSKEAASCGPGQLCTGGLSAADMLAVARRLIDADRLGEAQEVLTALRDLPPALETERLFLEGQLAVAEKDYDRAANRYREILSDQPELQRVRLELARALFLAKRDRAAEYHFRLVLADAPPEAVAANIWRFLSIIRERRVWRLQVEFGIVPDSNANAAPDDEVVELFGLPFDLSDDARQQAEIGVSVLGRLLLRPRLTRRVRFSTTLSAQHTEFIGSPFDDTVVSLQSGPEVATGAGIISPSFVYFHRWFADRPYNEGMGARLAWEKDLSRSWQGEAYAEWRHIDNLSNDGLDGPYFAGGLYLQQRVNNRSYFNYQLALRRHATDDRAFAYYEPLASVGYGREFPMGLTGYLSFEGAPSFYGRKIAAFGRTRRDTRLKGTLAVVKRDWNFHGFAPMLRLSYTRNLSNIDFYEYTRLRSELTFTRTF